MENLSTEDAALWEAVDLPYFDSLPFIFPNWQRPRLQMYKQLAIEKEKLLQEQKMKQMKELRDYVAKRIQELEMEHATHFTHHLHVHAATPTMTVVEDRDQQTSNVAVVEDRHQQIPGLGGPHPQSSLQRVSSPAISPFRHFEQDDKLDTAGHDVRQPAPLVYSSPRSSAVPNTTTSGSHYHYYDSASKDRTLTGKQLERRSAWKITAAAKGFLTKRLYESDKVQHLRRTVKDADSVLKTLPDLSSTASEKDLQLNKRVTAQLMAAKIALHEIFFVLVPRDQMAYIAHTRVARKEKMSRSVRPSTVPLPVQEVKKPTGRLSAATLKAIERKKYSPLPTPLTKPNRNAPPSKT